MPSTGTKSYIKADESIPFFIALLENEFEARLVG